MTEKILHFLRLLIHPLWQLVLTLLLTACATNKPYYGREAIDWEKNEQDPENKLLYTVFLIGDVGSPSLDEQEPTLKLMQQQMHEAGEQSATIFLGDNVYHNGLPDSSAFDREISEQRLNEQLDILKGYPGEKYMIPGNHDWNHSGRGGLEAVMREQVYVNEYLTDENIVTGGDFYVPGEGCPGPYEVKISDDLVLVAIDSEWWLHPFDRPYGENSHCGAANEIDFLVQLEDIIEKNSGSDILVVGHHPLMTRGAHGGFFSLKDHLFPLTMLRDWMFLPLPVIGSIYPFARKYGGILQDIPHPRYQAYIEGLTNIFEKYDNIIYAAGHEHALEYFKLNNLPLIVSGSGCKTQYINTGGDAVYLHKIKGFSKVLYYENGEVWTEFWVPEGDGATGKVSFRTPLYAKKPRKEEPLVEDTNNYADSTVMLAANTEYQAEGLRTTVLGEHYREEWATPVEVPLLDMKNELGGLTPYQKGGGKQTASLKVRTPDAKEYTLRSVNKDPSAALPDYLKETAARALLQDQISAQHPYGALVVPKLADAAGVFHTNPRLVYIPNTPYLRRYMDEFGNTLAFLEEDADENHEETASLGNAENLVGTEKVLEELEDDNDNEVDEQEWVRARLLDMLIGDWDRHEGQWRWVEREKPGKGDIYIPVPEDRDQAFIKVDGISPWLATRKWGARSVQNFDYEFNDIIGLNLSALTSDRTFTASVTREDWLRIARDIKANVTDAIIEDAVSQLPESIQALSGAEIAAKLKSRRDKLPQAAEEYYEFLAKKVDVSGSDKHELFIVDRVDNNRTELTVLKTSKEGEVRKQLYNRTFYTNETDELRLYGRDGQDEFKVTGNVDDGILIRIIGGGDEDVIMDSSKVSGLKKHTIVYDTEIGNTFEFGPETKDKTSPLPDVNRYDRDNYQLPYVGPRLSVEYNVDDGLFLGAGMLVRTHKFRKTPYASEHLLQANFAFLTKSYNIHYIGDVHQVLGDWSLLLNGLVQGPQFQRNFYGFGNLSEQNTELDRSFYRVRFERMGANASLYKDLTHFLKIGVGPTYDRFKVTNSENETFLLNEARAGRLKPGTYDTATGTFDVQHYAGVVAYANMNIIGGGTEANPRIGMRWHNQISYNYQLDDENLTYTNISSAFSFYISPSFPFQLTWAGRVGAAHNFGDFRFYQANTLGGMENLRGYRRTRYSGRSAIFANAEARMQLFDYNLYLSPGKIGVLGFFDAGRVYDDNDQRHNFFHSLHNGYGGGVWIDLLNRNVVTLTYAIGEYDRLWALNFGFLF
ncbi:BamA/TamA family outer membrane protein [Pontibacter silvestris]|uniref:BamA/TamA family outer membrane protein n=1 Tax=Pontibacter silvestris TaxID=2305183 RepID=A0ABW4X3X3_9BACT|nr:BamA/TamA family outer membrane protein [Pontibacter silvestris]MCC9137181.1 metallophosphoesterase [Pontibacter silvestris]